ncbi:metal-dependent hydrolase [Roseomonas elaeocarpi]|uniref:Metal-dependent hydrolase n=1 Tax=Roseomonas elaeocarpi TaxID=907779 RepID=A0ABV6JR46_9PROT
MMAGSHIALGAAAWLVAAPHFGLPAVEPLSLGLAVLGSLLPDIDHPKSWAGRRVRPLSNLIGAVFGHRGLTHSALAVAACLVLLSQSDLRPSIVAPLVVGYLSHLAADLLTPKGLRLAWPLRGNYALPLCRTGSPFEPLVVALVLCWAGSGMGGPALVSRATLDSGWRELGLCRLLTGHGSFQPCATSAGSRPVRPIRTAGRGVGTPPPRGAAEGS